MNNFKFITRVVMPCTREQFIEYLEKPLIILGYDVDTYTNPLDRDVLYIVTKYAGINKTVGLFPKKNLSSLNTMIPFNPKLFLALAAMTDAKYGIAGEWWLYKEHTDFDRNYFTVNKLYKAQYPVNKPCSFIDNEGLFNGYAEINENGNLNKFRKATAEEIIKHFTNMSKNEEYECKDFQILTFDEFKEKIYNSVNQINQVKTKVMEAEKQIIGRKVPYDMIYWDLKKDEIIKVDLGNYGVDDSFYKHNGKCIPSPIFESWEPIYEKETIEIIMGFNNTGTFILTIKDGECYHQDENISSFVTQLISKYNGLLNMDLRSQTSSFAFGCYSCVPKEIMFKSTGCQNKETSLSQWIEVFNKMRDSTK